MRIIQFVNTLAISDGGPARNSFELNITLNETPDVVADLFWLRGPLEESVVSTHNCVKSPLPTPGPRTLGWKSVDAERTASLATIIGTIRHADIIIIHGYYLIWIPFLAVLLTVLKKKFVITPHGSLTSHQQYISRFKKKAYEKSLGWFVRRMCVGFVTGSVPEAEELRLKFPASEIAVAGVGTSIPDNYRSSGTWGSPVRLVSISRIAPKKRIDLSIEALAHLRQEGVNVVLDVAGSGDRKLTSQLQALAARLKVSDFVFFHGQVEGNTKEELYLSADIFLLPSDDENFGIGLAEALAHGVPAVVSNDVAASVFLSPTAGSILLSPSGAAIADAVNDMLKTTDAGEFRLAARHCAEERYSWESAVKAWMKALSTLGVRSV